MCIQVTLGAVKPMTYKIDTCRFLVWYSALKGWGKDWLAQYQENVTEWDIGLLVLAAWFPVGQHYKVTMSVQSQVDTTPDMTLDVTRMYNTNNHLTTLGSTFAECML